MAVSLAHHLTKSLYQANETHYLLHLTPTPPPTHLPLIRICNLWYLQFLKQMAENQQMQSSVEVNGGVPLVKSSSKSPQILKSNHCEQFETGKIPATQFRSSDILCCICEVIEMLYNGKLMTSHFNPILKIIPQAQELGARGPWPPRFCNFSIGIRFLPYKTTLLILCAPQT